MGNEIEIKDLDIKSTSFLPTEIKDIDGITDVYSLEEEFSKTKKNRNLGLYLTIGAFFLVVIGCAFAFSIYIQNKNKNVEINISEFEDLRLKEVIDSARSHENNLDLLLIKLEVLKVDLSKKILEVRQKHFQRELALLTRELPKNETDRGIAQIRAVEQREIAAVSRSFENEIKEKEQEIEDIKKDLAEKKAAEESGTRDAVSNIDRLNALKMEELKKSNDSGVVALREYYEQYVSYLTELYNPTFNSSHVRSVINTSKSMRASDTVTGYHPVFHQEGIVNYNEYQNLQQLKGNNRFLLNRIQRIPYEGTVSPSLNAISSLTHSIENEYETLLKKSNEVLRYKNGIINNYKSAFEQLLSGKTESGYIINADNPKAIHIHLNEVFKDPVNTTAIVFREDDEFIGRITIIKIDQSNILRAGVIELAKNKSLQPFDKILLEIN